MENFLKKEGPFLHLLVCERDLLESFKCQVSSQSNEAVFCIIDGHNCVTLEELFAEFSSKLQFPRYFGRNWPAFDECLNDLDWLEGNGYVILITNSDFLLRDEGSQFKTFFRLIEKAVMEWVNGRDYDSFPTKPTPFHVIFQTIPQGKMELEKRFSEAERAISDLLITCL